MNAQLVLENVGMRLPNRVLFEGVNWSLYEGMRVALAGRNGSGKSTLLRIMAGVTESSSGKCNVVGGKRLRVGFLDQTLLERAVAEASHMKDKSLSPLDYIQERLLKSRPEDELAELEWETKKILSGLGFSQENMDSSMHRLSGGWLLRMFIAAALLEKPEVLLLDEPTNHLDLSSIQWLEEFLQKEYEGSLVLVTHDVALQKRTTDSLAILHGGRFYFRTHQHDYLTFRESLGDEKRIIEKNIEATEKRIGENMEFVHKFRAKAQTAARAQSKLKAAEDMKIEVRELKEQLIRIEGFAFNMHFNFRLAGAGGKFPISTKDLSFKYSENGQWILKGLNIDISRGQRVAIIGDNGAGKTTLLNVLASRLKASEGEVNYGHGIEMGYFGQHQLDELMLEETVFDNLRARAHGVSVEEVRGWLGAFGFGGNDEINKKAKVLSGGEKARLALLRILVTRINLCLLDEPTNHLDIETKDLLKKAVKNFEGTVITISHDREFIGDIAERIIYLSNDHKVTDHIGSLDSFFEKYPELVRHIEGSRAKPSVMHAEPTEKPKKEGPQLSYEERKKVKNQIKSLEKKIAAAEIDIERIGGEKNAAANDYQKSSTLDAQLTAKMAEWEKWNSELETLRQLAPGV